MSARMIVTGGAILSLMAAALQPASAQEKLVGTYGEVRTVLTFKVPDAALQKFVPAGWQAVPFSTGPAKGANMSVNLIDYVIVQDPDGKAQETVRVAALTFPARKVGTETTVPMVFSGFASNASSVPGAYGSFELAKGTVVRNARTDPDGKSTADESWDFKGDNEASISVQLQYAHAPAARSKVEVPVYSAKTPTFYRIYRIEQALDVVRSTETGVDRVQKITFRATGQKHAELFDGTEKLVSITSIPWYTRQVFLPNGASQ
jgi:hypothetical protein